VAKRIELTCDDCFFRMSGLCALLLESPCPTFRGADRGLMEAPKQPRLVPRPVSAFAREAAAAA
jgi:hypothetical protein